MEQVIFSKRANRSYRPGVGRDEFVCLEVNIPQKSDFFKRVLAYAHMITPNLYKGGANSSEERADDIVEIDNKLKIVLGRDSKELKKFIDDIK